MTTTPQILTFLTLRPALLRSGLVAVVLGLALAGCSGAERSDPQPGPSSPQGSRTPAPALPAGVTPAPIPTKVANDVDVRQNVTLSDCAATKNGWGASGTATNPGKKPVSYAITVFFTTTSATTINSARVTVDVEAGATTKWSAPKRFAAPRQMLCVLRGVATA